MSFRTALEVAEGDAQSFPSPLPSISSRRSTVGASQQHPSSPLTMPSPQTIGGAPKSVSATLVTEDDDTARQERGSSRNMDDGTFDSSEAFSKAAKKFPSRPSSLLGDRSVSTSIRLRRQGFQPKSMDFAVRSIRRGSAEWHQLLRPFVADLAFRSLEYRRYHSGVSFRPYTCQAAVLFCDLSNYSGITSLIAHRGAHALSNVVNAYFSRLLSIVNR